MRIALLAAALLLAPPLARACDTDYLNSQLTLVCRAALDPALALLRDLAPQATAAEAAAIARAGALAEAACETGDPEAGAQEAIRLTRLAGRIEARLPEPPAIWPARQAAR
ncbi:hypothetical protein ACFQY5_05360 [Paeniroseomonas aquatica]|jgi:hypothetical protein|uniref:UrcA family protein n=1 Tax=Paeniroseomonas aquatica TaxID=373043 RepID=A0ABT8ADK7_9PROT|nr:hypothetical protein [Paeniroseomonas aquatica]MDN3567783.1 hypothetical protein [Paeniroseomonas aquatica]